MAIKASLIMFLLWAWAFNSHAGEHDRQLCAGNFTNLNQWPVVQVPKRVLLIPLLRKDEEAKESERWPERPASILANFYRRQFHAKVTWLRNVRTWDDYYREVNRLLPHQATAFDRVILIGHGGFDGPILTKTEALQKLTIKDSQGHVGYATETQPGKQETFSLTYDVSKNKAFSAYVANSWRELTEMAPDEASRRLYEMKARSQPLDKACFARYCASVHSTPARNEAEKIIKMNTCEDICRGPLFLVQSLEEIKPERFFMFAKSLNSLTRKNGLIFFGACNPGTVAPREDDSEWDYPGFLTQSELVGGPYRSYVHMFADASDRVSAGPIGQSSADDIVQRIMTLEKHGHQHHLCIAGPAVTPERDNRTPTQ